MSVFIRFGSRRPREADDLLARNYFVTSSPVPSSVTFCSDTKSFRPSSRSSCSDSHFEKEPVPVVRLFFLFCQPDQPGL